MAGASTEQFCGSECKGVIRDWVDDDAVRYFPVLAEPAYRFDSAATQAPCNVKRGREPAVHAVVMAPFYRGFIELPGTQNDAKLLKGYFTDRGVQRDFLRVLDGDRVTRKKMLAALDETLPCVRERDQLVFVFTGGSTSYGRWFKPGLENMEAAACDAGNSSDVVQRMCKALRAQVAAVDEAFIGPLNDAIGGNDELVHFSSEVSINVDDGRLNADTVVTGLRASEVANFVTQVRNRGADAFVVLDTNFAAANDLLNLQRSAVPDGGWEWNPKFEEAPAAASTDGNLAALYGSGQMAAFYAANATEMALESPAGADRPVLGNFMFAFTESLRQSPGTGLVELAQSVAAAMAKTAGNSTPVFEASFTGLRFLTPREAIQPREQDIEVIAPAQMRGAVTVEAQSLEVIGRYVGKGKPSFANIDGQPVNIDGNGQFRAVLEDIGGKTAIQLRVYSATNQQLAARSLQIMGKSAEEDDLPVTKGRYALIITNQEYSEDAFPDLLTPKADGDAIAALLTGKFGFKTVLEGEKTAQVSLRLNNASKAQIQNVLFQVRRRLTAEDQLIVYYAGHGENDPDLGAYWVPVDGQPNTDFTWYAADDITRELKRINSLSVLVISDSCYAGGLSRGGLEEKPAKSARDRYLAKASRLKSRQLITSGGEEPVADGGGGGHSVFARALIEALSSMPEATFTASELFEEKVKPAVISAANSVSEGQIPGFYRISRSGDEPGSEFIFEVSKAP